MSINMFVVVDVVVRGRRRGELEMGGGEEGGRLKERVEEEDWDRGVRPRERRD